LNETVDLFGPAHLPILDQAAHLAGDLVSEAFQLDLANFRQWPVDVRHQALLAPTELALGVLAQVICYRRKAVFQGQKPDFYRVCLYDPAILSASAREGVPLPTLLTYVLTHEFVHVARFVRFLELASLAPELRAGEEGLVHAQTRELLAGRNLQEMPRLLALFDQGRLALDNLNSLDRLHLEA
jgi:predicted Zn-dependent protease with MMP-like domain